MRLKSQNQDLKGDEEEGGGGYAFSSAFIRNHRKASARQRCSQPPEVRHPQTRTSTDHEYVLGSWPEGQASESILPRAPCLQNKYQHNIAVRPGREVTLTAADGRVTPFPRALESCGEEPRVPRAPPGAGDARAAPGGGLGARAARGMASALPHLFG